MHGDYEQRFLTALMGEVGRIIPFQSVKTIGNISNTGGKQHHLAVYVQLQEQIFFATTAGVSALPVPPGTGEGIDYFELCAFTRGHSPNVLWRLSNIANYMLGAMSPMFYGSPEQALAAASAPAGSNPGATFRPLETIRGGDERLLLVPRVRVKVPQGPTVQVIEPMLLTDADWQEIGQADIDGRLQWLSKLGLRSMDRWTPILSG
ncbi:hypothetical protein [Hyalangium gracile]|uniref:hypothetical protein n=1 Tax=Hyalangium gracile TaxID=394092 RepID=UPI001CCB61F6|nr:hypothetical protein [Hyalangium gracile]